MQKPERKWGVTNREAFAIVWSLNYFRSYLLDNKFELFTDHRPLTYLRTLKFPSPKITRWLLQLEEYDYTIIYKEGKSSFNADTMSRLLMYNEEEPAVQGIDVIELSSFLRMKKIRKAQKDNEMVQRIFLILETENKDAVSSKALWPFISKLSKLFVDE